jgi:hypothetical protein
MSSDKSFEHVIDFIPDGKLWQPVVSVTFLRAGALDLSFPLLFDTGASQICLSSDCEEFFPDSKLEDCTFDGIGGASIPGKHTAGQIRFLGRVIDCDIGFAKMKEHSWMRGVFGRECFSAFGFGYWEADHRLYVTVKP